MATASIYLVRNVLARDLGQGVHGGFLLSLFFVAPPGGRKNGILIDEGSDLETLAVIRTLFVQQQVLRSLIEFALGNLLQVRLEIAGVGALGNFLDFRTDVLQDKRPDG